MRIRILAALTIMIPGLAQAGPPGGLAPTPTTNAVVTTDMNRLFAAIAQGEQAKVTLAQYKAASLVQRYTELTSPTSSALRSPSARAAFDSVSATPGKLSGHDELIIVLTDGAGQPLDAATTTALQQQIAKEVATLDVNSPCLGMGWPVVTVSFAYKGGKIIRPAEVSEAAPMDVNAINCLLAGVNAWHWQNLGNVQADITWLNVGGP
jgi:hypothetical protein